MDSQQEDKRTEKLIEEMLEFLETNSEEEEEIYGKFSNNGKQDGHTTANDDELEDKPTKVATKVFEKSETAIKSCIAKELKKLDQQFPIWNTTEIVVSSNKKSVSLPQSPTSIDEPIWRQSSLSTLNKSVDLSVGDVTQDDLNENSDTKYTNLETNCRRSSNNAYVQEVRRAIYGDTRGHPINGSVEYRQAAQNYAIYGKEFLDFPQDMQMILSDPITTTGDKGNCGNGLYPIPTQTPGVLIGGNLNESSHSQSVNSFGKLSTCAPVGTTSTTASSVAAVSASTAAYYQLCNMQSQARSAYGMFLGNKVTYVTAAPTTAPPMVYNQHTSQAATNFISNSLANAALATSPAILYTNPMLTTTTQQYLNAFFKETQYLNTATAAATACGNSTQQPSNGIYERLIYAQMLQQQIYHQSQQAAAIAMLQHKQRAARMTTTNGSTTNGSKSGAQSPSNVQQTTLVGGASPPPGNLNLCGRQATGAVNNSPDPLLLKQQSATTQAGITVNCGEESSKIIKE